MARGQISQPKRRGPLCATGAGPPVLVCASLARYCDPRISILLVLLFGLSTSDRCRASQAVSRVTIHKIELVQSVQDSAGSVPLVGGKATIVRVYISASGPAVTLNGHLLVQDSSDHSAVLGSGGSLHIDPALAPVNAMASLKRTLNFSLLDKMVQPGSVTLKIQDVINAKTGHQVACDNCNVLQVTKTFQPRVTMRLRIVLLTYISDSKPHVPLDQHVLRLKSWLLRAYPISDLQASQELAQLPDNFDFSCNMANARLAILRANDTQSGMDARTHFLGLVSNDNELMQGCSSGIPGRIADPSVVASAPSGHSDDRHHPINAEGDSASKVFTEWYGGHELAHTFGRYHPGICNDESDEDKIPRYDSHGDIAGDREAFAYDAGDDSPAMKAAHIVINPRLMSGTQAREIMTYCDQPNWPSVYTYKGLYERLRTEANISLTPSSTLPPQAPAAALPATSGAPGSDATPARNAFPQRLLTKDVSVAQADPSGDLSANNNAGSFESIVARINLTKKTGRIVGAMQAARRLFYSEDENAATETYTKLPSTPAAELRFRGSSGGLISQFALKVRPDSDSGPMSDQFGLIQTTVPRPQGAATVELVFDNEVIDKRDINEAPPKVMEVPANANGARGSQQESVLQWAASHPGGAPLTYTVQGSRDGKQWTSLATGLTDGHLKLLPQQQMPWFRVIANDGFNDSEPTIIRSPRRR